MDSIDRLNKAVRYIEENLCEAIDYNEISRITLSPISAFQRFFYLTTGMSLSEYIRRRRLFRAATDLRNTDSKIIDIAFKYGYESSDAFSVAFKRLYNITPSEMRQSDIPLEPFRRLFFELLIKYIDEGEITMKPQNNILPNIRELCDGSAGKNYELADCMAFLMERINANEGKPTETTYHTFAGLSGDCLSQVYNKNMPTCGEYCVSGYLTEPGHIAYLFDTVGYYHTYITNDQINADKTMYLQMVMSYIDKGLPVIAKTRFINCPEATFKDGSTHHLIVGYEDYGKTLLIISGGNTPQKYNTEDTSVQSWVLSGENGTINQDWIFAGKKKYDVTFKDIINTAVKKMLHWVTLSEKDGVCFGAQAFRAWVDDIDSGKYDGDKDLWVDYSVYICNLATNSVAVPIFLDEVIKANPQYADMAQKIKEQYIKMESRNNHTEGGIWKELENLGGGFNVTYDNIRDKEKRSKIAAKIREAADCIDEVARILQENLPN